MDIIKIITKKRSGSKLSKEEIDFFVNGYTKDIIPDYQISSLLMAIYFQGMDNEEVSYLTESFINSGDKVDLSSIPGIKVDKHSTGGIGDKVSIAISPVVASLNIPVAKMSGRGLGHTGGTVDKLESIPGFKVELEEEEFINQVKKIGIAIVGQSSKLVPADKKFYALRDVTATVDSIPLIASSVMSKKIATGSDAILLDVKVGSGAFMKDVESASKLVDIMLAIGKNMNREVKAHITDMNEPLGRSIGNANEVIEAIETLKGHLTGDFYEIVIDSSATLVLMAEKASSYEEAVSMVKESINSGKALDKFYEWIQEQGGDLSYVKDYSKILNPKYKYEIRAKKSGFVKINSALNLGLAAVEIGAGRRNKTDSIDMHAGIYLNKKTSEITKIDEILCYVYSSNPVSKDILDSIEKEFGISAEPVERPKLIIESF